MSTPMNAQADAQFRNLPRICVSLVLSILLAPGPDLKSATGASLATPTSVSITLSRETNANLQASTGTMPPRTERWQQDEKKLNGDEHEGHDEGVDVTLVSPTMPSSGVPGVTLVAVTGEDFPKGETPVKVKIHLAPKVEGAGPNAFTSPTSIEKVAARTWRFVFTIPASVKLTRPTNYEVKVSGKLKKDRDEHHDGDNYGRKSEGEDGGNKLDSRNAASLTVEPVLVSKLVFTTQPANGSAGTPLANVVVQVQDASGNVVTGSTASITISSTPAGVGGTTTVAAVNGVATFSNLVFTTAGSYTLTAASTGLTSATSSAFTIGAGAATKLVFTTQPANGSAGTPLANVVVQVQDASGNVVTGSSASITITSTPAGVGGTTTVAAVNGVATFSNLVFTTAGSYTLTAASTGLTSATSSAFTIGAGAATKLVFTTQPANGSAGTPLVSVVVQVQDASGNVVTGSNALITISSTPAGVGGTTTVAAVNGVATFSNLVFTAAGSYTLTAASTGLTSATSNAFTIGAGAATKLVFTTQPANGSAGTSLANVVVQVQDASGNVVTGSSASITITSTPAGVGGTTTVAAVGGVATCGR